MSKKKIGKNFLFVALIIIFFLLGFFVGLNYKSEEKFKEIGIEELSLKNFQEVEVYLEGQTLFLKRECKTIIMTITPEQAMSIEVALKNKITERPLTHDIIKNVFEIYDIKVMHVIVHETRDGIYLAKIFLKQGNKILALDSRPSDAVAIALRFGAKIYVKEQLLEKGEKIC
ncbi:MAG: bifunctional nuclease family protein [Candidatus Pacearchaeota archaeon]